MALRLHSLLLLAASPAFPLFHVFPLGRYASPARRASPTWNSRSVSVPAPTERASLTAPEAKQARERSRVVAGAHEPMVLRRRLRSPPLRGAALAEEAGHRH